MPSREGEYVLIASMDVEPDKEDLFNEVYDQEHMPAVLAVEGVHWAERFTLDELTVSVGGEVKTIVMEDEPKYTAHYGIECPEVLVSDAWKVAVEEGRWPEQVRPYTFNRRHVLRKRTSEADGT
jgi:hypothetical protein